jgi:hypothetical protein
LSRIRKEEEDMFHTFGMNSPSQCTSHLNWSFNSKSSANGHPNISKLVGGDISEDKFVLVFSFAELGDLRRNCLYPGRTVFLENCPDYKFTFLKLICDIAKEFFTRLHLFILTFPLRAWNFYIPSAFYTEI